MKKIIISLSAIILSSVISLLFLNTKELLAYTTSFCLSGGTGAISCSVAGGLDAYIAGVESACEVECAVGFYACCNLGSCKCTYDGFTGTGKPLPYFDSTITTPIADY